MDLLVFTKVLAVLATVKQKEGATGKDWWEIAYIAEANGLVTLRNLGNVDPPTKGAFGTVASGDSSESDVLVVRLTKKGRSLLVAYQAFATTAAVVYDFSAE